MSDEDEIDQAVNLAAVGISVEIDRMFGSIPPTADPAKVAERLLEEVSVMSGSSEFVSILVKAMAARKALIELGIEF
jgi:hypothetical protein